MEACWLPGLWMGKRAASGEHVVAISAEETMCSRACRPLGRESVDWDPTRQLWQPWVEEPLERSRTL